MILLLQGTPLPQQIGECASVPYENSFVLIGGIGSSGHLDTVYEYEAETKSWKVHPKRLSRPKREMGAVGVRKEIFPKCD